MKKHSTKTRLEDHGQEKTELAYLLTRLAAGSGFLYLSITEWLHLHFCQWCASSFWESISRNKNLCGLKMHCKMRIKAWELVFARLNLGQIELWMWFKYGTGSYRSSLQKKMCYKSIYFIIISSSLPGNSTRTNIQKLSTSDTSFFTDTGFKNSKFQRCSPYFYFSYLLMLFLLPVWSLWPFPCNPNRAEGYLEKPGHSCVSIAGYRRTLCNATPALEPFVTLTPPVSTSCCVSLFPPQSPHLSFQVPSSGKETPPPSMPTMHPVSNASAKPSAPVSWIQIQFPLLNTPNKTFPSAAKCQAYQSHLTGRLCLRHTQQHNTERAHAFYIFQHFSSSTAGRMYQQAQDGYLIICVCITFLWQNGVK